MVARRLAAGDDGFQKPRAVRIGYEWHQVEALFDVHDVDHLPRVSLLIRMIQHVDETSVLDRGYYALEGDAPLCNELFVKEIRLAGSLGTSTSQTNVYDTC